MMPLECACPRCRTKLRTSAALPPGAQVRCPSCAATFAAPDAAPLPAPAAPTVAAPNLSIYPQGRPPVATLVPGAERPAPVATPLPSSAPPAASQWRLPPSLDRFRSALTAGLLVTGALLGGIVAAPTAYLMARSGAPSVKATSARRDTQPAKVITVTVDKPAAAPESDRPPTALVDFPAPDIDGTDADGKRFRLSEYRGKVVVLDFWGDWCPFCRRTFSWERELVNRSRSEPLAVLGVNNDADRTEVRRLLEREKIFNRCWCEGAGFDSANFYRWNIRAVPTIVLIDHRGVIRHRMEGAPGLDEQQAMNDLITRLVRKCAAESRK